MGIDFGTFFDDYCKAFNACCEAYYAAFKSIFNPGDNIIKINERFLVNTRQNEPSNKTIDNDGVFDTKEDIKPPPAAIPLFLDRAFYKGRNNLLYSDGKVGKSLLSIEIAKHAEIKKPFFILMEDYNGQQAYRYTYSLKEKVETMSRKRWNEFYKKTENDVNRENQMIQMLCKKWKLDTQNNLETVNNIIVLKGIMRIAVSQGVDFICIDSLDALLPEINTLKREVIEEILEISVEHQLTMLLIHHENKQGESAGPRHLKNSLDHIYHLSKSESQKDVLCLDEEARYGESSSFAFKRISVDEYSVRYELIEDEESDDSIADSKNTQNVKETMIATLSTFTAPEISYDEFWNKIEAMGIATEETFKNKLPKLEKGGYIEKKDGKTWVNGIIIKKK